MDSRWRLPASDPASHHPASVRLYPRAPGREEAGPEPTRGVVFAVGGHDLEVLHFGGADADAVTPRPGETCVRDDEGTWLIRWADAGRGPDAAPVSGASYACRRRRRNDGRRRRPSGRPRPSGGGTRSAAAR